MSQNPKHILLCGNRRSGRSSMIRALLQAAEAPISGFMTRTLNTREDGYHEIYMFPYGSSQLIPTQSNHIGDCNGKQRVIFSETFDRLGVSLLQPVADGILVMDEIGFMESDAVKFCNAVLELLNGDIPVLAAVRTSIETPFIQQVLSCEKALKVEMRPDKFDEILAGLLPVVTAWGKENPSC